jgi:hypothetical protein
MMCSTVADLVKVVRTAGGGNVACASLFVVGVFKGVSLAGQAYLRLTLRDLIQEKISLMIFDSEKFANRHRPRLAVSSS